MSHSVSFVDNDTDTVLFTVRDNVLIPRTNEMVEFSGKWYKVKQIYYTYHSITGIPGDDVYCLIEVNLERSEFE
jgi:hypothetical protein